MRTVKWRRHTRGNTGYSTHKDLPRVYGKTSVAFISRSLATVRGTAVGTAVGTVKQLEFHSDRFIAQPSHWFLPYSRPTRVTPLCLVEPQSPYYHSNFIQVYFTVIPCKTLRKTAISTPSGLEDPGIGAAARLCSHIG